MIKKLIFSLFASLIFVIPAFAATTEDFSQMSPTVKVTSYRKLFIGQALAYGSGSGTVITPDGVVVTNHHVIFDEEEFRPLDAFEICITFDVQKEPVCKYTARLMAYDKDMDIALLKINGTDVFGKTLPSLKYLDFNNNAVPKERTEISVVGYPASGGETITVTKGQISGFEKFNDYNYFKTDTDFDHGSSGGTALDSEGNYIGIPTYIRSYAENVGYFLDLREARKWIGENIGKDTIKDLPTGQAGLKTENILKNDLARLSKANDDLKYTMADYPNLEVTLPAGWEFLQINDTSFFASQKNLSNPVGFSVHIADYQYEIDQGYMDKLDDELSDYKQNYPDYKKEDVTFAGQKAWKISYTSYDSKNYAYYIPYGYTIVGLSYSIDLNESDKQEAAMKAPLESFKFTKIPIKDPTLPDTIKFDDPLFQISAFGDFRIQKNNDKQSGTLLAEAVQKNNFEGSFAIYYEQIPKDERQLSAKERLDDATKNMYGDKLLYKNDEVVLGGLKGFLYTYEYEGSKYQQIRKHLVTKIRNNDYEFSFEYDDLTADFDKNLGTIKNMLDSFKFNGEGAVSGIPNSYGNLGSTFNDVQFHRFAQAISDLSEKGIIKGYPDGGFHPEQLVSRGEALKIILESKNYLENDKKSKKAVDFSQYEKKNPTFKDVNSFNPFLKYIQYAYEKKFLSGYSDGNFRPNQNVNLVEALKLIINTYEIPVWGGDTDPWYKKYMDKGFELSLIPYGMYDPAHNLTRAELAYLVSSVYKQADKSFGF